MATAVSPEQTLGTASGTKPVEPRTAATQQAESKQDGHKNDGQKNKEQHAETMDEARWQPVLNLPCQLTVDLPLPAFHVSDLLKLHTGSVIGTNWQLTRDVPLRINGTLIGWSEFEVVGNRLAVRLTELA